MLRHAGIKALRSNIPSADEIFQAADERLLCEFGEGEASSAGGAGKRLNALASKLLQDRDPVEVVARLLAQTKHEGPCGPEKIETVTRRENRRSMPSRDRKSRKASSGSWARFQVSWGKHHGAEPGRLLAMVCRRGGINSSQVGEINIGGRSSMVEVDASSARSFARAAGRPDPRDPMIKFRQWQGK